MYSLNQMRMPSLAGLAIDPLKKSNFVQKNVLNDIKELFCRAFALFATIIFHVDSLKI